MLQNCMHTQIRISGLLSRPEHVIATKYSRAGFAGHLLLTTSVAVVRRAEDGDNILVMAPVIALHDQLMRS